MTSPLGRYAPPPDDGAPLTTVRLLGLPVRLHVAAREHHDELLRELRLLALADDPAEGSATAGLAGLVDALGVRHASADGTRPDDEVDAAADRGEERVDLSFAVAASAAEGARRLAALLAAADEAASEGRLMTVPRSPVLQRFAQWYLDEVVGQLAGAAPVPWDGPVTP